MTETDKSVIGGDCMYLILYLGVVIVTYVATFKNDFTDEDIQTALPLMAIIVVISVLSVIVKA